MTTQFIKKQNIICLIVISTSIIGGCAKLNEIVAQTSEFFTGNKKVPVTYINPPNDTRMADANVKNIAITSFKGDSSNSLFGEKVTAEITGLKHNGKSCYTIIARENISELLNNEDAESEIINMPASIRNSLKEKVDTVIVGSVNLPRISQQNVKRERTDTNTCVKYKKKNKCEEYRTYHVNCVIKTANLEFSARAIAVDTAKVVFSNSYSGTGSQEQCADQQNNLATDFQLESQAIQDALTKLTKDLAPYTTVDTPRVRTGDDSELENNQDAFSLFEKARDYVGDEKYGIACSTYQKAVDIFDASPSLNFNVGICKEREGDFKQAIAYYEKANNLYEAIENETDEEILSRINIAKNMESKNDLLSRVCQ